MTEKEKDDLLLISHGRTQHPYRMWDSIHLAPEVLQGLLEKEVVDATFAAAKEITDRGITDIVWTGTGTSYFSGLVGQYALAEFADMPSTFVTSHEFANYPLAGFDQRKALVGISHSGGTLVLYESVMLAKKLGGYTVGITDVAESRLGTSADIAIVGPGGRDLAIPKTRSYISGIMRAVMLAAAIGECRKPGVWERVLPFFTQIPDLLSKVIRVADDVVPEMAKAHLKSRAFYTISVGNNVATCWEASLKLLEGSLAVALGLQAEEAIHGPLAAVDKDCSIMLIAPAGKAYERVERIAKAMQILGVPVFSIAENGSPIEQHSDQFLGLPIPDDFPEVLTPILYIAPLYLMAYWIALHKNINPDILRSDDPLQVKAHAVMMPPGTH